MWLVRALRLNMESDVSGGAFLSDGLASAPMVALLVEKGLCLALATYTPACLARPVTRHLTQGVSPRDMEPEIMSRRCFDR